MKSGTGPERQCTRPGVSRLTVPPRQREAGVTSPPGIPTVTSPPPTTAPWDPSQDPGRVGPDRDSESGQLIFGLGGIQRQAIDPDPTRPSPRRTRVDARRIGTAAPGRWRESTVQRVRSRQKRPLPKGSHPRGCEPMSQKQRPPPKLPPSLARKAPVPAPWARSYPPTNGGHRGHHTPLPGAGWRSQRGHLTSIVHRGREVW